MAKTKRKPRPRTILSDVPDLDSVGGRIRRARDTLELKTAELARRVGVTTETAVSWETNRSHPRANRLTTLAGVLNVSPTWLLFGLGESPTSDTLESELSLLKSDLARTRRLYDELGRAIGALDAQIGRLRP